MLSLERELESAQPQALTKLGSSYLEETDSGHDRTLTAAIGVMNHHCVKG